jgi:hypothetical protein
MGRDVGQKIEGKIAQQLGVAGPFFKKLVDCTKSRKDYCDLVQKSPVGHVHLMPKPPQPPPKGKP